MKIKELGDGSDAIKVQADLRKVGSPDKIVEATRSNFGDQIDILVNNAGAGHIKSITESTAEDFDWIFHLNVRAVFLMTKAVLPHLRAPVVSSTLAQYSVGKVGQIPFLTRPPKQPWRD